MLTEPETVTAIRTRPLNEYAQKLCTGQFMRMLERLGVLNVLHCLADIEQKRFYMITKDLGNRIKYLRKASGLSQEKLALKAEIDRTYLAGIESGKRNATIVSIEKIVNALEVSMKEFWDFKPYC